MELQDKLSKQHSDSCELIRIHEAKQSQKGYEWQ